MKKDKKKSLKELGFKVKKKPSWSVFTLQDAASKIFNDRNQALSETPDDNEVPKINNQITFYEKL